MTVKSIHDLYSIDNINPVADILNCRFFFVNDDTSLLLLAVAKILLT